MKHVYHYNARLFSAGVEKNRIDGIALMASRIGGMDEYHDLKLRVLQFANKDDGRLDSVSFTSLSYLGEFPG